MAIFVGWLVVFSIKRKTKDWFMEAHLKKGNCTQLGQLTETIPKEDCYVSFREGNCSINWIMTDSWSERDSDFVQDTPAKSAETPAGRRKICDTGQVFLVGPVSPKKTNIWWYVLIYHQADNLRILKSLEGPFVVNTICAHGNVGHHSLEWGGVWSVGNYPKIKQKHFHTHTHTHPVQTSTHTKKNIQHTYNWSVFCSKYKNHTNCKA